MKAYDTSGEEPRRESEIAQPPPRGRWRADPRTIAAVGPFTSPEAGESTIPITNRAGLLECSPANSYARPDEAASTAPSSCGQHTRSASTTSGSPRPTTFSGPALAAFATHDLDAESALVVADPE